MSTLQRIFTTLFRSRAGEIEAESRRWIMRGVCGHEVSVWDAGGVRWKARGNAHVYRTCPVCGRRSSHMIFMKDEDAGQPSR